MGDFRFVVFAGRRTVIGSRKANIVNSAPLRVEVPQWVESVVLLPDGIAHPLLAIAAGGYFPGLVGSPFIGGANYWLWRRLREATRREAAGVPRRENHSEPDHLRPER